MTEEQNTQPPGSPLIDPETVKNVVKPTAVDVSQSAPTKAKPGKPTADQLQTGQYCWGTGRRKKSIARVRIRPGEGKIIVNKREFEQYFPTPIEQRAVTAPLQTTDALQRFDVFIDVHGGGRYGQAGASTLGIARALCQADPDLFHALREKGYLTRDSRMKERKKYGQKGARKRFQFSKR